VSQSVLQGKPPSISQSCLSATDGTLPEPSKSASSSDPGGAAADEGRADGNAAGGHAGPVVNGSAALAVGEGLAHTGGEALGVEEADGGAAGPEITGGAPLSVGSDDTGAAALAVGEGLWAPREDRTVTMAGAALTEGEVAGEAPRPDGPEGSASPGGAAPVGEEAVSFVGGAVGTPSGEDLPRPLGSVISGGAALTEGGGAGEGSNGPGGSTPLGGAETVTEEAFPALGGGVRAAAGEDLPRPQGSVSLGGAALEGAAEGGEESRPIGNSETPSPVLELVVAGGAAPPDAHGSALQGDIPGAGGDGPDPNLDDLLGPGAFGPGILVLRAGPAGNGGEEPVPVAGEQDPDVIVAPPANPGRPALMVWVRKYRQDGTWMGWETQPAVSHVRVHGACLQNRVIR
jgi:hypothetical protein